MPRVLLVLGLAALLALPAAAGDTYKIDGGHSSVLFRVKHLNVAYFYGSFRSVSGSVTWDADPAKCAISVKIKTASVFTGHAKRDKHITSSDFLDANQFPELSFTSTSIAATKATDQYKVSGKLMCHGVSKDVSFTFTLTGKDVADPWGNIRVGGEAVFTIKRSDFGMTKMKDKLGDEIRLIISLEGMRPKDGGKK